MTDRIYFVISCRETISVMKMIEPNVIRAIAFASKRHRGQTRKGLKNPPYIHHPIQVMVILTDHGEYDSTVLMAAALHDVIEDTAHNTEQISDLEQTIRQDFGPQVLDVVREVSDDKQLPFEERKRLQVVNTPGLSDEAKKIKIADKTCNIMDMMEDPPTNWSNQRKLEYLDWAGQVVEGARGVNPELEDHFDRHRTEAYHKFSESP